MTAAARSGIDALRGYLDASPTPRHAVEAAAAILENAGFDETSIDRPFPPGKGRRYVRRAGSLIAWQSGPGVSGTTPLRIVAAHTDSPGFRIKPEPESASPGGTRLGVEVYGGPLLNSWLDRDLGLAGGVLVADGTSFAVRTVRDDRAVVRIPQLAIHLDRGVNDKGLKLDRQQHLQLLWSTGREPAPDAFSTYVAELADVEPGAVRGWDLAPFDLNPARICGRNDELLASARLDDLFSCHAALAGLITAEPTDDVVGIAVLVDHEEVGSTSATGANGRWVSQVIERIAASSGADRTDFLAALAESYALSLDMAHATHPNYPERHDPVHPVHLGAGPVVKHNAQQRYATELTGTAKFLAACDRTDVPVQHFVSHSEMPCGSTIGPAMAAGLGIPVTDVGVAQLAMHSVRELCGIADYDLLLRAVCSYLSHT